MGVRTTQEINEHRPSLDNKVAVAVNTSLVVGGHTSAAPIISSSEPTFIHTSGAADVLFLEAANLHISDAGDSSAIAHDNVSAKVDAHTSKGADDEPTSVMPNCEVPEIHGPDVAELHISKVVVGKQNPTTAQTKRSKKK